MKKSKSPNPMSNFERAKRKRAKNEYPYEIEPVAMIEEREFTFENWLSILKALCKMKGSPNL